MTARPDPAGLYVHAEQLQSAIDDIRSAAMTLAKIGRETNSQPVANLGGGLLSVHARAAYRFADLLSALRHYLEGR